ncbi:MAG: GTP cyclohydrolase FolE2 [Planctomycetota bacterium]
MGTTATMSDAIPDVQSSPDRRSIAIDKVGVKSVAFPMTLKTRDGGTQTATSSVNMYVSLPHHQKGTHMSRFLEVLGDVGQPLTPDCVLEVAREIKDKLDAEDAHIEVEFTYFIPKSAPVTGRTGLMDYKVKITAESNNHEDFVLTVGAPATSLCPCSKEISAYGAHNQRCFIEASVRFEGELWIEDLAEMLERSASCEVYPQLKRPDEKFVTEAAFDNPKFVEDIVRDLAITLDTDERVRWYTISSTNYESIHNHDAYAQLTRDKRDA